MNFIERLLHIAPDDGSGMLEAAFVLVAFAIPAAIAVVRHLRHWQMARDIQD